MRRLLVIAAVTIAACVATIFALIRQPTLVPLRYRGDARADAAALRKHVIYLTTTTAPRGAHHPEMLDAAAAYIANNFRANGARVSEQLYDARQRGYRNVIARFGPAQGAPLVIGAHYDAFVETASFLPGADDNASGVAGLLEVARLLGRTRVEHPVLLVAYSTEEPPFFGSDQMGSAVHAQSLRGPVRGMICLEMIGYYAREQRWPNWFFAALYPSHGNFIGVAGRWDDRALTRRVKRAIRGAGGIDVYSLTAPRISLDASDHRSYWDAGITAVVVTDTADLRNPHYHTRGDTADTLDYEKMARVVDGILNAATQ